jgi:hypothetical protein
MPTGTVFAVLITVVGVLLVLYAFGTGRALMSLPVVLGMLCVADGVLRLLTLRHNHKGQ